MGNENCWLNDRMPNDGTHISIQLMAVGFLHELVSNAWDADNDTSTDRFSMCLFNSGCWLSDTIMIRTNTCIWCACISEKGVYAMRSCAHPELVAELQRQVGWMSRKHVFVGCNRSSECPIAQQDMEMCESFSKVVCILFAYMYVDIVWLCTQNRNDVCSWSVHGRQRSHCIRLDCWYG